MKKHIFTLVLVLIAFAGVSQGRMGDRREQVKSLKVAYITNQLALTPDESAKFWPLYNAYDERQHELRRIRVADFLKRKDDDAINKMTEKEALAALSQMEKSEEELYELRKKFLTNLKTVLPPVKIIKLRRAEEDFNRDLLRQYRQKKR